MARTSRTTRTRSHNLPLSIHHWQDCTVLLHFDIDDHSERSKREVEAVAYVVDRYFDLVEHLATAPVE
jgi:hypothetical protein